VAVDEKLLSRVRTALRARRGVAEKRMFGGVAFMLHGHMCCGILGATLMVRLDPEQAQALLAPPNVRPMDLTGRPMRGFLYVDGPAIRMAESLKKWVDRAVTHAAALPAKLRK
jgi:TfoX/Sxy family transcriptional regulator of competence genes